MKRPLVYSAGVAAVLLIGCAPIGWSDYRAGMRCTLKDDPDCQKYYENAIAKNPKLPGLHSSYGTYLYSKGNKEDGVEQLQKEVAQYPQAKKAVEVALNPGAIGGTENAASPDTSSGTADSSTEVRK